MRKNNMYEKKRNGTTVRNVLRRRPAVYPILLYTNSSNHDRYFVMGGDRPQSISILVFSLNAQRN